ncbi:MAG TPA: DNA replication and repair protein RecF [Methylomirabilota bacterium]|nr:DNA replication and repair protein RecF [Methylomirabilota bacterium]
MHVEWIELSEFRSYSTLSYLPTPTLNVIVGPNGQGKTNLLESLGLLLAGRSFRGSRAADLVRWAAPGAAVQGEIRRADAARLVRRSIAPREDGVWAVLGEGCPWARAIPFGWQDLALLNGGPQARRGFLDGFGAKLFPAHAAAVGRYRRVIERRNHLLQSGKPAMVIDEALEPWDAQLARVGIEILTRRRQALEELVTEVRALYPEMAGAGDLSLGYRSSLPDGADEGTFVDTLRKHRVEEMRRGQTLVGPHRDDMSVDLDGRDMRLYASRGQQRLLALALRLAEARPVERAVGSSPVLLLDDALSELDPTVQVNVLRHVEGAGQVFLTTADDAMPARHAAWWQVREGQVLDPTPRPVQGAA